MLKTIILADFPKGQQLNKLEELNNPEEFIKLPTTVVKS